MLEPHSLLQCRSRDLDLHSPSTAYLSDWRSPASNNEDTYLIDPSLPDRPKGAENDEFGVFKILFSILDPTRDSHKNFEYHLRMALDLAPFPFDQTERILHSIDLKSSASSNLYSNLGLAPKIDSALFEPRPGSNADSAAACHAPACLVDAGIPPRAFKMARTRKGAERSSAVFGLEGADADAIAAFSPILASILGRGAHGTVYAHRAAESRMAVKAVRCRPANAAALSREIALLFLPRHPGVAALLAVRIDHEEDEGARPAGGRRGGDSVVMLGYELAAGGSLDAAVGGGRRAEYGAVVDWVAQVLQGLEHLHTVARVAHHDIKPANLLLFPPRGGGGGGGAAGRLKICDFGSCWPMGAPCVGTAGTPLYMSPTQVTIPRRGPAGPGAHRRAARVRGRGACGASRPGSAGRRPCRPCARPPPCPPPPLPCEAAPHRR
jgi:hypothetical protein